LNSIQILAEGINKPKTGVDKGDHPPITPMKAMDGWLSGGFCFKNTIG
jgi:hypothetical protein